MQHIVRYPRVMGIVGRDVRGFSRPNAGEIAYVVGKYLVIRPFSETETAFLMGQGNQGVSHNLSDFGRQFVVRLHLSNKRVLLESDGARLIYDRATRSLRDYVEVAADIFTRQWFANRDTESHYPETRISNAAEGKIAILSNNKVWLQDAVAPIRVGSPPVGWSIGVGGYFRPGEDISLCLSPCGQKIAVATSLKTLLITPEQGVIRNLTGPSAVNAAAAWFTSSSSELVVADVNAELWRRIAV